MKFTRIIIYGYNQFGLLDLDLTYGKSCGNKAGQPLEKVCLIGSNGTGKSTLLRLLYEFWNGKTNYDDSEEGAPASIKDRFKHHPILGEGKASPQSILVQFIHRNEQYELVKIGQNVLFTQLETDKGNSLLNLFQTLIGRKLSEEENLNLKQKEQETNSRERFIDVFFNPADYWDKHLCIYSPAESSENPMLTAGPIPDTTLDDALEYFDGFPAHHQISFENFYKFWELTIYQVKKRENDRTHFENQPENLDKSKRQLINEFERNNPDFLKALSEKWNVVLARANLYFDYQHAKVPIQLNDNLEAYIKVRESNSILAYAKLSSGIRHLLLRLGYLLALYHRRTVESALALFDEPENSLFPSILYDLINVYTDAAPNTQFFFATHSPIIASQFDPEERIILEFNEEGKVEARKGVSPEGDDPNDVLIQDFGLENILGKKGLEKLHRYIELKTLIKNELDPAQKDQLVKEYLEIGNQYHFGNEAYS